MKLGLKTRLDCAREFVCSETKFFGQKKPKLTYKKNDGKLRVQIQNYTSSSVKHGRPEHVWLLMELVTGVY